MKNSTIAVILAALSLQLAPISAQAQNPPDPEARARAIAQNLQNNGRTLTIFDRDGKVVAQIGARHIYNQPSFSPDGKRIVYIKPDLEKETSNVWVMDVATGTETQITFNESREPSTAPVWSPDGREVSYVGQRGGYFALYRRVANGDGPEELLYRHPGAGLVLTDWSTDGRFLSFYTVDLTGGILWALPVTGDRKPVQVAKSSSQILAARYSPDGRFLAYRSNESGRNEIHVRPFDPTGATAEASSTQKWQISEQGGLGMVSWRRDGKELYYLGPERAVMAVDVDTTSGFKFSNPRLLFKGPDAIPVTGTPGALGSVSRDGQRIIFAVPPAVQLQQLTVFDREGKVVSRIGEPGLYQQPHVSPDGTRVVVVRNDQNAGTVNMWVFDLATGKGTAVTNDAFPKNAPAWSHDGKHVLYVSTRGQYAAIYRKPSDGSGAEEMLFRYTPGAGMVITDVSPDGKLMVFSSGGVVNVVALTGTDPLARKEIEFSREEFDVFMGRFSPDSRFMAYISNESKRNEIYVRPIDPSTGIAPNGGKWQVTKDGVMGNIFWRADGQEMYFLKAEGENERHLMAVDVSTKPSFKSGTPKLLFKLAGPLPGNPAQWKNVTPDGQKFVFSIPIPR